MSEETGTVVVPQTTVTPVETVTTQAEVKPEKTFTQSELDAILEKRIGREKQKREDLRRDLDAYRRLHQNTGEPQTKADSKAVPAKDEAPKREDFEDYESYIRADARYEARQVLKSEREEDQKRSKEARANEYRESVGKTFSEREASALNKYDDYEDVTRNPNLAITDAMADAIQLSDVGPDLYYHLGKNPKEAMRIAQLAPILQIKELGRLEARLEKSVEPTVQSSKAPKPIEPIGGKSSTVSSEPKLDGVDATAWAHHRNRKLASKRTGKT